MVVWVVFRIDVAPFGQRLAWDSGREMVQRRPAAAEFRWMSFPMSLTKQVTAPISIFAKIGNN